MSCVVTCHSFILPSQRETEKNENDMEKNEKNHKTKKVEKENR